MRRLIALVPGLVFVLSAMPASAAQTAFRITSIYLRDPHAFVNAGGCRDITDPDPDFPVLSFNEILNSRIQQDNDGDGKFDQSDVLVFDPLDQTPGAGDLPAQLVTGTHLCSLPEWMTACWLDAAPIITPITYYNNPNPGSCSFIEPGSTHGYTPAITLTPAPCFVAIVGNFYLNLGGVPIHLFNASLAATYVGNPATGLVNGMISGYLPESTAANTMLPAAIFGENQPLSMLLPGGPGNCAGWSDKDGLGWYVYLNFTAVKVTYRANGTTVGIRDGALALTLDAPHPNPFNPSTEIRYVLPGASLVRVTIYDASGRMVRELANEEQVTGDHSVHWNGRDARGGMVSSGVYFVRLDANGETRTQKMVLLK